MLKNSSRMIKKLRKAISSYGENLLYDITEVYSEKYHSIQKVYTIRRNGEKKGKFLYRTYSDIRMVLFLRDYLFTLQGKELPTDNEEWNLIRKEIQNGK